MDPQQYPLNQAEMPRPEDVDNPLAVMQPGEKILCEIKRHPIGTLGVYSFAAISLAVVASVAILTPAYASFLTDHQKVGVELGCLVIGFFILICTYIGLFLYQANRLILTSDSITVVQQSGLFERQAHQLSLANLEDVSAQKDGFIQTLIGFGDLVVEAAGEHSNFTFSFCPEPEKYARMIIAAHEEFLAARHEEVLIANQPLMAVKNYNQPGSTPPTNMNPPAPTQTA